MAIFGPKAWVNPFGKISIFRLLELVVFIAQTGVFFFLEYSKTHFSGLYCLKKKQLEKWPFLAQKHGLTPLEKSPFFDFLNLLFLQPKQAFLEMLVTEVQPNTRRHQTKLSSISYFYFTFVQNWNGPYILINNCAISAS